MRKNSELFREKLTLVVSELMEAHGLHQKDIGHKVSSPQGLNNMLGGRMNNPSASFLACMKLEFGVNPDWLVDDNLPVKYKGRYLKQSEGLPENVLRNVDLWQQILDSGLAADIRLLLKLNQKSKNLISKAIRDLAKKNKLS
ncbi:hypothetical protein LEP1GSC050_0043 [Leptospira phage vB_LbrZ_5399-LE1]|uniref:DNA-binding helix-turn-helix protein n=1 Tax=Leptospira inadai serovar Lyme TaxID=293084 RepID=A0ABX4YGJ4_9LEPT|nr:hypothetical protein [Leptospira inadai]AGS80780.1 hypothetical protein LEP1GSC050_0043 [Leptospira phage vB_LbrZ_5399-LE1]PNV74309.1 hypothetical protein BES34_014075 [Leptospira inadai serovar Lyme]